MGDIPRRIPGDVTFFVTGRGVSSSSCSAGGPWGPHWAVPWSCHSSASLHPKAVISRGWHGSWARLPTCRGAGFGLLRQGCAELARGLLLWGTVGWLQWARGCRAGLGARLAPRLQPEPFRSRALLPAGLQDPTCPAFAGPARQGLLRPRPRLGRVLPAGRTLALWRGGPGAAKCSWGNAWLATSVLGLPAGLHVQLLYLFRSDVMQPNNPRGFCL